MAPPLLSQGILAVDHSNAEAFGAHKILGVEGEQEIGPAFHG